MIGAIAGDIIGSVFEFNNTKRTDFPLFSERSKFTDDSVLTCAVADSILHKSDYAGPIRKYAEKYPNSGYGGMFIKWLILKKKEPYNSYGNGSAMRVSPVGFAFDSEEQVLEEARKTAIVTHNHPEGIKGAQATALAVYLARTTKDKDTIRRRIEKDFSYDLGRTIEDIRPGYKFDVTCQGSVPEAIIAFLESKDFEDAIRKAVSLGGDSDTIACITGGIAQAFYKKIPAEIQREVWSRLPEDLSEILARFNAKHLST
ncbi:MAG: ADP-ribosylglycohydrolase family protein [Elusimicrobiota bacterium]